MKELLPIGSVVLLKDASKKLMIIGVMQYNPKQEKLRDYLAVPYPEGFVDSKTTFLFDQEDINDVIYTGYSNPEWDNFVGIINVLLEQEKDKGTDKTEHIF